MLYCLYAQCIFALFTILKVEHRKNMCGMQRIMGLLQNYFGCIILVISLASRIFHIKNNCKNLYILEYKCG